MGKKEILALVSGLLIIAVGVALVFGWNKRKKDEAIQSKAVVEWKSFEVEEGNTSGFQGLPMNFQMDPDGPGYFGTWDRLLVIMSKEGLPGVVVLAVNVRNIDAIEFPEGSEGRGRKISVSNWNDLQLVDSSGKTHLAFCSDIVALYSREERFSVNYRPHPKSEDFVKAHVWYLLDQDVPTDGLKFRFGKQSFSHISQAKKVEYLSREF